MSILTIEVKHNRNQWPFTLTRAKYANQAHSK